MFAEKVKRLGLVMWRPTLEDVPSIDIPNGYKLEWYQPGDARHWVEIHRHADPGNNPSLELYSGQFGGDDLELARRQCFLRTNAGATIGTATAWFDSDGEGHCLGVVHWVAILPGFQGNGLAKLLTSAILLRMRQLGHSKVYLATHEERFAEINLYLRFGFIPWAWDEDSEKVWRYLARKVKPEFCQRILGVIEEYESPL